MIRACCYAAVAILAGCASGGTRVGTVDLAGLQTEVAVRRGPLSADFVVAEVLARNYGDLPRALDLRDLVVLDPDGVVMRRLEPEEAANMVMRDLQGAPNYPPKWVVREDGDQVVVEREPMDAALEAFSESLSSSAARYRAAKADEVYDQGLGVVTDVPPHAAVRGWAYFLGKEAAELRVDGRVVTLAGGRRE